jgi:hypothetical protein
MPIQLAHYLVLDILEYPIYPSWLSFLSLANNQFTILVSRVSCTLNERHNSVATSHVSNTPFLLVSISLYSLITTQRAVGLINQVKIAVRTKTDTMKVVTAIQDG